MDEEFMRQIEQNMFDYLEDNPEATKSQLYEWYKQENESITDEVKKVIGQALDDFFSAPLKYNDSNRGKRCTQIEKLSPVLRKLQQDNPGLEIDPDRNIVLLTKKNSQIIERLFLEDGDYYPFAEKLFERFGKDSVMVNKDKALFAVVREIDRDNSTNVWRYKRNRWALNALVEYMADTKNDFWKKLEKGEKNLPDKLRDKGGTSVRSLSSKVCKYLSEYAFKKDNYFIDDKFIRCALLFYLDYYS
jgi:hypothetical protein